MKTRLKRALIPISAISIFVGAAAFVWLFWREKNAPLPPLENPRLVVKKAERQLQLFDGEKLVKIYKIVLGFAPVGDKEREGDGRTPEGEFYLAVKNPKSKFFLSLGLSYPSIEDGERGLRENLISPDEHDAILQAIAEKRLPLQKTALGGEIYIHGGGIGRDWTEGCVALGNDDIQELFDALPHGVFVRIEP